MIRILSLIILVGLAVVGFSWYSAQSLPSWYDETPSPQAQAAERLSEQIQREGVSRFLGGKVDDIMRGELVLNETEFNGLFLASLKNTEDGRTLLAVSDAINAQLRHGEIELGAVINLDKVEKINPKARKSIEKVNRIFPFLQDSRVAVTVFGTPVVRNGQIGIKDDFHIKVGAIPISNDALRQLGAKVERANTSNLKLRNIRVKSVLTQEGQIAFGVSPNL